MTKTTLQNSTGSVVVLREGQAQVFLRVCDIQNNGRYAVPSELNQTYKEYMCASSDGSSQFTLSSDDLSEWKEIVIKPSVSDPKKFDWEGTIPAKDSRPIPAEVTSTTPPGLIAHPPLLSKVVNKIRGWFSTRPAETGTASIFDPAITTTAITSDPTIGATTSTTNSVVARAATATSIPTSNPMSATTTIPTITTSLATISEK